MKRLTSFKRIKPCDRNRNYEEIKKVTSDKLYKKMKEYFTKYTYVILNEFERASPDEILEEFAIEELPNINIKEVAVGLSGGDYNILYILKKSISLKEFMKFYKMLHESHYKK